MAPTDEESEPKVGKRRCVPSACVPCRKRKSKCDGESPLCVTCNLHKTNCFYDATNDRRPTPTAIPTPNTTTAGRKRPKATAEESGKGDDAAFIVNALRSLPECEAHELFQHIRQDQHHPLDLAALAETCQKTIHTATSTPLETPTLTLETDLAVLLGKPAITKAGVSRYFGHTSGLGLADEDKNSTHGLDPERKPSTWTTVTQDVVFIERLFGLYFQWSHSFYVALSREHFLADFYSGRTKYCSPLLVNAILAYACHFSDEPQARTESAIPRTAGDHFFAEARRLLFEDESPSLTTTQALCVMALREPSTGRDSSGFMYMGRCIRMAIELGLHVNNTASPVLELTEEEIKVRKITFWGSFTMEAIWSICTGRISQLPRAAITIDKPAPDKDSGNRDQVHYSFLKQFSILSELTNDNNYMFFAPKERFTSRRLLDCYHKYLAWYKCLPSELRLQHDSLPPQPYILMLHMLYHTLLVHLFRPMLKVELIHSDVRPRDICIESANKVSELLRLYRKHYSMRACHLIMVHFLLSINIVHLLFSTENETISRNLVEGLQALEDVSVCHSCAARNFKIIHGLSKNWNLPWPQELEGSRLLLNHGSSLPPPVDTFPVQPAPPTSQQLTINTHNRMQPQIRQLHGQSMNTSASEQSDPLNSVHLSAEVPVTTFNHHLHAACTNQDLASYSFASTTPVPPLDTTSTSDPTNTLFFQVPGTRAPIFSQGFPVSPMDIDNMLDNVDGWERLQRDGFKFSDTWMPDPIAFGNANANGNGNSVGSSSSNLNGAWMSALWNGTQPGG